MTVVDDRVSLSYWNGRPTVQIDVVDGTPLLHWLVVGHTEQYDVWLHATLTWEQADDLCSGDPGFDLGAYFEDQVGVPAGLTLVVNGTRVAEAGGTLDEGPNSVGKIVTEFLQGVARALREGKYSVPKGVAEEIRAFSAA